MVAELDLVARLAEEGGGGCAVGTEGMRKTGIFSIFFAINK